MWFGPLNSDCPTFRKNRRLGSGVSCGDLLDLRGGTPADFQNPLLHILKNGKTMWFGPLNSDRLTFRKNRRLENNLVLGRSVKGVVNLSLSVMRQICLLTFRPFGKIIFGF